MQPLQVAQSYTATIPADTGVGMDSATLSHAIEPFYSTKGVGKGTGLGLSMVHGLAGQSGGFLQLDSAEGYGTTATLWLPAADPEALAAPDKLEEWSQGQTGLNILLVDDEALVRQGTGAILHDLGHNVLEVDAGGDALGVLRSQPVDILVTDYLMPGMSGLELARSARKLRRDLPVLMITGFADLVDDSASDVSRLSKPFHVRELAQAIEREMNRPAGQ